MKTVDESSGGPSLEERFKAFLSQLENAEDIDSTLSDAALVGGQRADFLLAKRRIVLELKTLETDPEYKVEERLAPHRERPEFPLFYWQTNLSEVLKYLPDGVEIHKKIGHAVTRSVQGALEKADDQIGATKKALNIEDACGVVTILNERVGILSPELVAAVASKTLLKGREGCIRYKNISYVWIISEHHRVVVPGATEHIPLILLEGPRSEGYPEAGDYLDTLQVRWAQFRGTPLIFLGRRENFGGLMFEKLKVKAASDKQMLARHEVWRRAYRGRPYLRNLTEDKFIEYAAQVISVMTPHFLVDGKKLPFAAIAELMEQWTHILEEAEFRKFDMRKLLARFPEINFLRAN